jgi:cytochrome b6-f complex iron-sulfur subunit
MAETTRREFVTTSLLASAGMCLGALGCDKPATRSVAPTDGMLSVDPASQPELSAEGGSLALDVEGGEPILLLHLEGDQYVALARKCTHLGCKVAFKEGEVVCPCHGSRFATDGSVTKGPAKEPLASFPVTRKGNLIEIRVGS